MVPASRLRESTSSAAACKAAQGASTGARCILGPCAQHAGSVRSPACCATSGARLKESRPVESDSEYTQIYFYVLGHLHIIKGPPKRPHDHQDYELVQLATYHPEGYDAHALSFWKRFQESHRSLFLTVLDV